MTALRRPHRWLSTLALAASLLLSLLPTVGRLQQTFAQAAQSDVALAMCTVRGLEYVPASRADVLSADPRAPQGDPAPADHGDDCAYCPLLASLDLPAPPPMAHPSAMSSTDDLRSLSDRGVSAAYRMGLGPRGPPSMVFAG